MRPQNAGPRMKKITRKKNVKKNNQIPYEIVILSKSIIWKIQKVNTSQSDIHPYPVYISNVYVMKTQY